MQEREVKVKYENICSLLSARKLKPAFDLLEQLIVFTGLAELHEKYITLEQNYRYMLKYTVEGITDPERQNIYEHLLISTFELADNCFENLRLKTSQSIEYQKKKGFAKHYITDFGQLGSELEKFYIQKELHSLHDSSEETKKNRRLEEEIHLQKIFTIFYHIWFTDRLTGDELQFLETFMKNESVPYHEKSLVVTGLTLSLMRYFDEHKIIMLFNTFEDPSEEVSQRALIGLIIGIYHYDQRMPFYHAILGRLTIFIEDLRFRSNLEKIILQFIRSKETEKIKRKLEDEIFPEMLKLSPNLRNKLSIENLLGEGMTEDKNPEWKEILKDSPGLLGKMEELTEMQLEGADVFLSSFSMLKHFPFFSEIANWFVPFTPDHPEIKNNPINKDEPEDQALTRLIMKSPMLCNSDKYSFFFSITNIPPDYKQMVEESLNAEAEQLEDFAKEGSLLAKLNKSEIIINHYIRDLYRFYKIHPQHEGFEDIFAWKFDFHHKFVFSKILKEDLKIQRNIAEFNFSKNYFVEAAELFELILQTKEEVELVQKLAYCYQKMGDYKKALDLYLKADLFDQNKLWNYKKIALCYRNLKKPAKALEYYQLADVLDTDNLSLQVSIGQCQMELKQYEEALKSYFKVEYLAPGDKKVWRPIGWCSFLVGKIAQAEKYYERLISDFPNKFDLMNMGHVQWCLGNRKFALDFYKRSINDGDNTEKDFMEAFEEDLPSLVVHGVDLDDVPIMMDQLRYFLAN